jgi:thiol-disulfide isomerase/thioredoxin
VYTRQPLDFSTAVAVGDGLFPLEPSGPDTFAFKVAAESSPLYVQVTPAGATHAVEYGPFVIAGMDMVSVDLSRQGAPVGAPAGVSAAAVTPVPDAPPRGDYRVFIRVKGITGKNLSGRGYELVFPLGDAEPLTVAQGVIPVTGVIDLQGLAGGERAPAYTLIVDGTPAGIVQLDGQSKMRDLSFSVATLVGTDVPEVPFTDVQSGATVLPSQFRGQMVLLMFWSTWCPSCKTSMARADEIAARRAAEWNGKVAFVGASIDERRETPRDYVTRVGWRGLKQVWCGPGAWKSAAATKFGVTSIPRAFLLDGSGKIVWTGSVGKVDVERMVATRVR